MAVLKSTPDILELLMNSKKNLVEGGHSFFYFFKGAYLKKSFANPDLDEQELVKV